MTPGGLYASDGKDTLNVLCAFLDFLCVCLVKEDTVVSESAFKASVRGGDYCGNKFFVYEWT